MEEEVIRYIIIGAIAIIAINFVLRMYETICDFFESGTKEIKAKMMAIKYMKERKREEERKVVYKFYGLFEFEFEDNNDKDEFKKEYCATIADKIKLKYKNKGLQLTATDKVFFNFSNFASFEFIVDDFLKLFSFFVDINKKRNIPTKLKFSFWTDYGDVDTKRAFKILSEMNGMDYKNQIVVNEKIYNEVKKQGIKLFDYIPCGLIKLHISDEDVEIYKLTRHNEKRY